MSDLTGQTIAHYSILEKLGEGGMGVVYKAHDTKLDRFVALKFLTAHLGSSQQDKARFSVEAKAAAALNHPNVCSIIDIQEHDGRMFIVMEFVDGQTLREKSRSANLKQGIDIGIQIADGLAAAHEKGIVHRDIKPENIMIRKDGIAQIMDFGLAKVRAGGSRISRLTKEGSTVGTAGYMSPEQIQGLDADHRSDIFSYGVLLYELLAGQLPFRGAHETALMYEIVNIDPPPMSAVKPEIDPALDAIVLECLAKDPSDRSQSIAEVAKDLRRYKRESTRQHLTRAFPAQSTIRQPVSSVSASLPQASSDKSGYLPWVLCALFALAAAYFGYRVFSPSEIESQSTVSSLIIPDSIYMHVHGNAAGPPAISADGKMICFTGVAPDGVSRLYVRSTRENTVHKIDGTDGCSAPFWSPDGKHIGFFAEGKLKRIDPDGSALSTICVAYNPRGGTWTTSGTVLFTPEYQSPIYEVGENGGAAPRPVTRLDTARGESSHRWPVSLPDGKHFLYYSRTATAAGQAEGNAVFIGSTDGTAQRLLVHTTAQAVYASGYLLYLRANALMAQKFDLSSLDVEGDPVQVADGVANNIGFNAGVFCASQTGVLMYQQDQVSSGSRLLLLDRAGTMVGQIGDMIEHVRVRWALDGKGIITSVFDPKNFRLHVWEYHLGSGDKNVLTSGTGESYPVPTPGMRSIICAAEAGGEWSMLEQEMNTANPPVRLGAASNTLEYRDLPSDCSPDGTTLLFNRYQAHETRAEIWGVKLDKGREMFPVLKSEFSTVEPRYSPDGKWIAYASNEPGDFEIYVRPAASGVGVKVSNEGGTFPHWLAGNSELVYISRSNKLVQLSLQIRDAGVTVVSRRELFSMPAFTETFDVSPDGKTFVVNRWIEQRKLSPVTFVTDWTSFLKK